MEFFQTSDKDEEIQKNWADCEFDEDGESAMKDNFDLRQKIATYSEEARKEEATGVNDLRHKLSQHSPDHVENSETNKESPFLRHKIRENDLRLKLSRNRENQMDCSSIDETKRRDGSERGRRRRWEQGKSKYTERVGGLSPLRSPRASTLGNILDLDNSRNHRFTRHLQGNPASSPALPRKRQGNQQTPVSGRSELSPSLETSDSDDGEEITRTTPDNRRKASRRDRTSWTRRRLELPSERAEGESRNLMLPTISEEDQVRLARREKDISYGKNTDAYQMYINLIPRELRSENSKKHPRTPKKNKVCSRRSWDAQVKIWKKRIHAWASEYNNQETAEESSKSDSENPLSPMPTNSWANIVARGRLPEDEQDSKHSGEYDIHEVMESVSHEGGDVEDNDEVNLNATDSEGDEEDAHAFLDSADIDFSVAHQVQQQVRLDDV